jgi:PAS domain S-box-containing protein
MNSTHAIGVFSIHSNSSDTSTLIEEKQVLEELAYIFAQRIHALRLAKENKSLKKRIGAIEKNVFAVRENDLTGNFVTTKDGRIKKCNTEFAKILHYDSVSDIMKMNSCSFYFDDADHNKLLQNLKEKGKLEHHTIDLRAKDGVKITVLANITSHLDITGEIVEISGYMFDITDKIEITKQLLEANEKVDISEKIKNEFLSQISHEIRTPLNIVLSNYYYIKNILEEKNLLNAELVSVFNNVNKGGRRIIKTIELILSMAELNNGGYKCISQRSDLFVDVIEDAYQEIKFLATSKNLQIILLKDTSETEVFTDPYAARQILQQILDNSIKFTETGSITISVDRNSDEELRINVEDTGVGISEDYLPTIFELFSQEEFGYKRNFDGNGLGLAYVKKLCDINNIKILIQSKKGIGTTVTLIFPK